MTSIAPTPKTFDDEVCSARSTLERLAAGVVIGLTGVAWFTKMDDGTWQRHVSDTIHTTHDLLRAFAGDTLEISDDEDDVTTSTIAIPAAAGKIAPVKCYPLCVDGTGHTAESCVEDQTRFDEERYVPVSRYPPRLSCTGGYGSERIYVYAQGQHDVLIPPEIEIGMGDMEPKLRLTASEARALAEAPRRRRERARQLPFGGRPQRAGAHHHGGASRPHRAPSARERPNLPRLAALRRASPRPSPTAGVRGLLAQRRDEAHGTSRG